MKYLYRVEIVKVLYVEAEDAQHAERIARYHDQDEKGSCEANFVWPFHEFADVTEDTLAYVDGFNGRRRVVDLMSAIKKEGEQ
jgi:hypothetical protein